MLLNHFVTAVLLHSAGQCDVGRGGHFQTSFEGPTRVGPMASGGYTASTMTRTKSFGTTLVLSLKKIFCLVSTALPRFTHMNFELEH